MGFDRGSAASIGGALAAVVGLGLAFAAFKIGHVGLAAAVVSIEGVWAALLAVSFGGVSLHVASWITLAFVVVGMLLAAGRDTTAGAQGNLPKALALALAASLCFGASLYLVSIGQHTVGWLWQTASVRVFGSVVAVAVLASGRLASPLPAWRQIVGSGVAEVIGMATFIFAVRRIGVAVPAVVSSQFALVAAVIGYFVLHERMTRRQLAGAAIILASVGVLTALES